MLYPAAEIKQLSKQGSKLQGCRPLGHAFQNDQNIRQGFASFFKRGKILKEKDRSAIILGDANGQRGVWIDGR